MNTISANRLRICILTKADTLSWTQHYVDAFRERAEVITVGPGYDAKQIEDWNLGDLADTLSPNDIEIDLDPNQELRAILPDGWNPDLVVAIANGSVSLQPNMDGIACPKAYITVDTWQSISDYVECQHYDFVFPVQKTSVDYLRAVGGSNVFWLPLGCNPAAHYPVDAPRDRDVAFAGSVMLPVHQQRYDLLQQLEATFSTHMASRVFRDELCRTIARGKLVFNHSAVHEVNMRVFEVMAMGRPLITNRESERNGLTDLFEDGKHLILYDGPEDLIEKVRYYLDHDEEREAIAQAGYALATTKHRYLDRIDTLLAIVAERVPSFGKNQTPRPITNALADLVPYGARELVDVGLELNAHLEELTLRGTTNAIGVEIDSGARELNGYNSLTTPSQMTAIESDILVVRSTADFDNDILGALDQAYAMLRSGGTLIVRLGGQDFSPASGIGSLSQLEDVFALHGFHVTACRVDEANAAGVIVRARKRTRKLTDIVAESYALLPHVDTVGLARWAAAFGPNY